MNNRHYFLLKSTYCFIVIAGLMFMFARPLGALDADKEEAASYIKDVSSMMTDIDITIRNISMNTLSFNEGIKRLGGHIFHLGSIRYPGDLSRQHKAVLLSFKKLRMGLLLFSPETKDLSMRLIKSGRRLLKSAAMDILDIAKRQGIIKEGSREEEKREEK